MPKHKGGRQPAIPGFDDPSKLLLLDDMPIGLAIKENDTGALGKLISSVLPGQPTVSEVTIQKSVGEAFTGGRSTPVYYITCRILRPAWPDSRKRHLVAKLVEMGGNADWRKRESYAVERRFYDVAAGRIRNDSVVPLEIPRLIASDKDGAKAYPAVCFLMNDVRQKGYTMHPDFLSVAEAKRALKFLAAFHAIFWNDAKSEDWRRDLWSRGGFWTDGKDCTDNARISSQWAQTVRWLQSNHPDYVSSETKGLGKRLQDIAAPLDKFLSAECVGDRGTMIHGDFKAANLFFTDTCSGIDPTAEPGAESVAAVDFQFVGAGLGAEDVAYLLFPDARGHFEDHQEELLRTYHETLILCLIEQRKGGPSTMPFESFRAYYELSRIDFVIHLLGRGWVASTGGDALLVGTLEKSIVQIDGGNGLGTTAEYLEKMAQFVKS